MDSKEKRRLSNEAYEKRNKATRKEKACEAMQRCRACIKTMPVAQQEAAKMKQQAYQAKHREKLCLKADLLRWRSFMEKYEDNPSQMPDDRTHRRGHIYHPEDYSPHRT
ncbi:hypothetical protein EDD18DRAFT_1107706 [Armillaria luteobubalina]|uniref:Uncharacterized protein n=1 Tax=Armillaria luteobubalina TaxID=153913 RepID=A0AA39UR33_9AGAR|nr:hypothetical protein EDD18DRAFT_1107706 [Armillaria luteobubalina]